MSCINVTGIQVLDNPTKFCNPFQFEITFECVSPFEEDLEWTLTYVGSAESTEFDQVLDSILLGPISVGLNKFVFQADPPDTTKIPNNDILGVTVLLLSCSYKQQEFIRVGYYVSNELEGENNNNNNAVENTVENAQPTVQPILLENGKPDTSRIIRNILTQKPRVTLFPIDWGESGAEGGSTSANNNNLTPLPNFDKKESINVEDILEEGNVDDSEDIDDNEEDEEDDEDEMETEE